MEGSYSRGEGRGGSGSAFGRRPKPRPAKNLVFDYKDADGLKSFVSETGKIVPRRISRLSAKQQRRLTREVKRARLMSILPFARR